MSAVSSALQSLDPELQTGIIECVDKWNGQEGDLIHEIQNRPGFVPRKANLSLSGETGVPLARIYEVLTFYDHFRLVAQGLLADLES